ncbi:hypothetical protein OZX56_06465 [Lactobacillus sp. ESL0684]|uniref:IS1096 element passenger TnpR family protein n=1 Tax=Lactobacillus sp. ESL0684 TaxID=2983213 RepID=UPI0023F80D7F|nr:hypothetical protein [Lactobacillus sp. ESL0684]WEV43184.1 hypothetical protein OZX56_06465 [Lactobacillus sp. ESL0684]
MKQKHNLYEFKATLKGSKTKIWRRYKIDGQHDMVYLVDATMALFKMFPGVHLYALTYVRSSIIQTELRRLKRGAIQEQKALAEMIMLALPTFDTKYLMPCDTEENLLEADLAPDDFTPGSVKLQDSGLKKDAELLLKYDFGDDWEVSIKVEKVEAIANTDMLPTEIIKGKGYGIIEDIGGTWGLNDYQESYEQGQVDPDIIDFLGGEEVDLTEFNLEDAIADVKDIADNQIYRLDFE